LLSWDHLQEQLNVSNEQEVYVDIYTAFLFGVLVGQWALLFAIWRAATKLIHLLDALERSSASSASNLSVRLLEDGSQTSKNRRDLW